MVINTLKHYISLFTFLLAFSASTIAQNYDTGYFSFEEDSLGILFDSISKTDNDEVKVKLNELALQLIEDMLYDDHSFNYSYDSLKNIGILKSDDELLRIYTWNMLMSDYSNQYFGFIQYFNKHDKEYTIFPLIDMSAEIENPERVTLTHDKWYGALYYSIIETKGKRHKYYTLLGWDGNNELTSKKIIDVLYFTQSGKPRFGTNIFYITKGDGRRRIKHRQNRQKRIIFEFSSNVVMALRYEKKTKMIVFDHLSPSENHLQGNFQYYGPDWSYDALKFHKGKWQYYIDIDPRNPKPKSDKPKWHYLKSEDVF